MARAARITEKDAAEKLARQRLSVLELAQALGSVSEACRRRGMDRTSFYEWRRRFQTHGFAGLKDLPPITSRHPEPKRKVNYARNSRRNFDINVSSWSRDR